MNPKNIPAPGPYEVVVVIDEEGKARGARGEKWVLIKNGDGAIASVYPAVNSEATARILAAGSDLLKQLRLAVAVIEDNKGNLASLDLDEKQMLVGRMKLAIAQATGEPLPVAIGDVPTSAPRVDGRALVDTQDKSATVVTSNPVTVEEMDESIGQQIREDDDRIRRGE